MAGVTRLVVLVAVLATNSLADNLFQTYYQYSKVMTACFGEKGYYEWMKKVEKVNQACQLMPPSTPPVPSASLATAKTGGQTNYLYNDASVRAMVEAADAQVSNFTCTLQKLGSVKKDLSLDYQAMEAQMKTDFANLTADFKDDLMKGFQHCRDLVTCLPMNFLPADAPAAATNLMRAIAFIKCDKKIRMKICMKQDLKKNLNIFDISSLPGAKEGNKDMVVMRLLHVLYNVEGNDDLKVY